MKSPAGKVIVIFLVLVFSILITPMIDTPLQTIDSAYAEENYSSSLDPAAAAYGARPLSMGGAFTALADDTNAIFTNPAGLSLIDKWSFTSMSTQLLQNIDYTLVGAACKYGPGTFGIGYIGTSAPCGFIYSEYGTKESSSQVSYDSRMVLLSYGVNLANLMKVDKGMGNFALGGSVKLISKGFSGVDGAAATGSALDLGITINPENSPFSYGAALKNIGSSLDWESGTKENLEQSTKFGISADILGEKGLNKSNDGNLSASLDFELLSDGRPMVIHVGSEYKPLKFLAIRLGLTQDPVSEEKTETGFTAGVGVAYEGFSFDYAYRANADSEELSAHYFSISFSPNDSVEKKDKTEKVKIKKEEDVPDAYKLPDEYKSIYLN